MAERLSFSLIFCQMPGMLFVSLSGHSDTENVSEKVYHRLISYPSIQIKFLFICIYCDLDAGDKRN